MNAVTRGPRRAAMLAAASAWLIGAPAAEPVSQGIPLQPRQRAVRDLAAGKLLVAARNLPDPNFAETVVLLASFSAEGAMGLIVNRATEVPLSRVLPDLEDTRARAAAVFFGGPVPERGALGLLRSTSARAGARRISGEIHLVNTRELFDEIVASGAGPERFRVYVGYAGWGAGQLDRETAEGSWHVVEGDATVVFDPDPSTVWTRLIRRVETRSACLSLPRHRRGIALELHQLPPAVPPDEHRGEAVP